MNLEKNIQNKILKHLNKKSFCTKIISANTRGVPDILVCYKGVFAAFEVKREKSYKAERNDVSFLQLRKLLDIGYNGGYGAVVRSIKDVDEVLERIDNELYKK